MQTISIILYDFNAGRRTEQAKQGLVTSLLCDSYAILRETGQYQQHNITVCGSETRVRRVFTSTSHRVEIGIVRDNERGSHTDLHYLLKYEGKTRNCR